MRGSLAVSHEPRCAGFLIWVGPWEGARAECVYNAPRMAALSPPDLLLALRGARYGELQGFLDAVQARFERRGMGEDELRAAYAPFLRPDPALEKAFGGWRAAYPDSYPAYAAYATWLFGRAQALRGTLPVTQLSDLRWRGTLSCVQQLEGFAAHAVTLRAQAAGANPLSAWLLLGRARNLVGCTLSLEDLLQERYPEWFARPLAQNPASLELRQVMLDHLRPEWGGSDEQMFAFVRQQEAALGLGDAHRLWADYHARAAHHALHFLGDQVTGVERARLAAELYEPHAEILFVALTRAVGADAERQEALERFLSVAEHDPELRPSEPFFWALYNSDHFLAPLLGRVLPLLAGWAVAGQHAAAVALGRLSLLNRHWHLPDPAPLLRRAREEGSVEAAETLVALQEEGLGLRAAVTDNRFKRVDILQAAELGSAEMSWRVYRDFARYREQFGLSEADQLRSLLRSADAGHNEARYTLAQELRAGHLEVGEDGVLRSIDARPLQRSLDYARYLLERAATEEHAPSMRTLRLARDADWRSETARRRRPGAFWGA